MFPSRKTPRPRRSDLPRGFSLLEMMAAMAILLIVAGVVTSALMGMMKTQGTISNRTEMHSSVRSATEVLQQEIGQAGRVALPQTVTLSADITSGNVGTSLPIGVTCPAATNCTAGMFPNELLVVDTGPNQETVIATTIGAGQITAIFGVTHPIGAPVVPAGAFANGIVPTSVANGSTDFVLKLFGDINGDGNMVYIEYTCNPNANGGTLYRNVMPFDSPGPKPAVGPSMILVENVLFNPGGTPCFSYQEKSVTIGTVTSYYVVNVAVTLTVQTQNRDPQTNQFDKETKALLNVSPRNVFDAWLLASEGYATRIQPTPATVLNLMQ